MLDEYLKANLARWDEWTKVHEASELYDVEGFRAGRSSLTSIEESELGPLVGDGTRLLHLQCHFGMDTLSWARRGATVTGVDFSGEAVELARRLADEVGLSGGATFLQSDVYELPDRLSGLFDVVFTSWGVLNWLGDLDTWARVAAAYVRPGGIFYMAEFHPFAFLLADDATPRSLRIGYPYFQYGKPLRFDEPGILRRPYGSDGAQRHLRVEPWLRRDHRPAAASGPAPRVPARVPLHARPVVPHPRMG